MRAAIFYVPEDDDPLARAGARWLGRDATSGEMLAQPSRKLACVTKAPARYGFHATLKPPMHLATSLEALREDVAVLAAGLAAFELPQLVVGRIGGALALLTASPSPLLNDLCNECVAALDRHRLPPGADELARRREVSLSALEEAMLERWGYPYVFEAWRFHMTLSSALPERVLPSRANLARAHFAAALAFARKVQSLSIFVEPSPGAPFRLLSRFSLNGDGSKAQSAN